LRGVAARDHHAGQQGKLGTGAFEQRREPRNDDGEQHHDRQAGHDQQHDRVDQRRAYLFGQQLGLIEVLGEPAQHVIQAAAGLASPNHADVAA
jgi:hypothetical protein